MLELERLSAAEIGRAVSSGEVRPTEVVSYFAERIKRRNPSLNAFVYVKEMKAMEAAEELEQRLENGENCGPFAGVPFGMKDFLPSKKGWSASHGGVPSYQTIDPEDSVFTKAMEEAGGIALGKTNAPAFGFRGVTDNVMYGPTCNPFDLTRNSGGSSGGSASAVADGLIPISEGGDAGGSIRVPAAWCNCFGFKASAGTVPSVCRPDAYTATHPYCCNGGLTKTVEDAAVLLNYMARFDPRDPRSYRRKKHNYVEEMKKPIRGMRIAYTPDFGVFPVESEIREVVKRAALSLERAGAIVEEVPIKLPRSAKELSDIWFESISFDTAIELELLKKQGIDLMRDAAGELTEEFIYWNQKALTVNAMDLYEFNKVRSELLDAQQDVFDQYDIILSPTVTCLPVKNGAPNQTYGPSLVNGVPVDRTIGFCETFFVNFAGNPAASIPAGLSASGLPIGMQIIGRRFFDEHVLALAYAYERIAPWRKYYEIPLNREIHG